MELRQALKEQYHAGLAMLAEAMRLALARHDALLHAAIEAHQGHVFQTMGDAFCVAFASAHRKGRG